MIFDGPLQVQTSRPRPLYHVFKMVIYTSAHILIQVRHFTHIAYFVLIILFVSFLTSREKTIHQSILALYDFLIVQLGEQKHAISIA